MYLVDIIIKNKTEKPVDKLEYFKGMEISFVREPMVGLRFMYVDKDKRIYRTDIVTAINIGDNYLVIETEHEAYIFVEGCDNDKD